MSPKVRVSDAVLFMDGEEGPAAVWMAPFPPPTGTALVSYRAGPVLILEAFDCWECGQRHEWELCPVCGSDVDPALGCMGTAELAYCESCPWSFVVRRWCVMCEDPTGGGPFCSEACEQRAAA